MLIALNLDRKIKPLFRQDNSSFPLVQHLKTKHLLINCIVSGVGKTCRGSGETRREESSWANNSALIILMVYSA